MLSFRLETTDNQTINLPSPVSVVYNSEYSVPADYISVSFPYVGEIMDKGSFISAYEGDRLVFRGAADEIIALGNSKGFLSKINARSMAGILLDNEAEPSIYFNASPEVVFRNNLQPFGFTEYEADEKPYYGTLNISKGMSEWQVLENYCRNKYGNPPRIEGNGKVVFDGRLSDEKIVFSEKGEYTYSSFKKNLKKYRIVTEVRLRLEKVYGYKSIIKNESADNSVVRRRLVDTLTAKGSVATADKIISESINECFEITLECPYRMIDAVGKQAEIYDTKFGNIGDLYIHSLRYTLDKNGEKTIITLRKVK